ncbi:facilitated trehalose transporter Tret1-like [Diorhabda carinulata]|uniref:facilitated trehalose transporter Tret1-like n=1 Tax=Diorhabda carinulata TaxID=1163345 RepID=UPI0025A0C61B|nr:facilitated trehalose transporter Tret1-like [Diorhabda carinulata]
MGIGTAIGWTSNITVALKLGYLNDIDMTDDEISWTGSTMNLGAVFSCLPVGFLVDKIGRKPTLLWSVIPFLLGWLIILLGTNMTIIYIGRFLIGLSCGSYSVAVPLYISEIAHSSIRGALGTFFQLFITIGVFYCGVFGYGMPFIPYVTTCFCIPVVVGIILYFQPESPVYYLKKDRLERADETFLILRGEHFDFDDEIDEILKEFDDNIDISFWSKISTKSMRKSMIICLMLMFYQQLSGYCSVMFYSQEIFKHSGSTIDDSYCVILLQSIQVLATFVSTVTIDRFGRKVLLVLSGVFMTISMGFIGLYYSLKDRRILDEDIIKFLGFMPVVSLNVFIIAHSTAFGPIPWIAASEFFSPTIKPRCIAFIASFYWFLALVVTKFHFYFNKDLGADVTSYISCFISFTSIFFVYFGVPETRGKTYNEIQDLLFT